MTAAGYVTDVAYIPGFYPHLAPVAMRHVAALNGVIPPRTDARFRVLELGCGLGRSLTTLAAANPRGEFVGVDINPEHTAAVARDIAAGGLDNCRIVTADFGHLPDDVGTFDFLSLHGVYSWVAPSVREEVIAIARERLNPGGLLLVSYNAMPGWAHLQPIRGILKHYASLRQGDSTRRMSEALAYVVFLRDKHAKYFDDNPRAAAYVDALRQQDVRYLAHEYLNEHWTSFYFSEVADAFGRAGLSFTGSLPVFTNFWDLCVRPEFQELFRTTTNRLVTEAHKDFCANTAFRWDLYAKAPRKLDGPEARLREVDDLHYVLARPGTKLPYEANLGVVTSTVQGPLYETLIDLLGTRSLRLSEIVAAERLRGVAPADVIRAVDAGVAMGLFDVHAAAVGRDAGGQMAAGSVPHAFNRALLAADALGGRPIALASELTGTGHQIGDLDAAILHELVERGRDGLADRVATRLEAAGRTLLEDGKPVERAEDRRRMVEAACDAFLTTSLPQIVRLGVASA
jgi:SAM-dependent methyltransferase